MMEDIWHLKYWLLATQKYLKKLSQLFGISLTLKLTVKSLSIRCDTAKGRTMASEINFYS